LAMHSGATGGTNNCVIYAQSQGKEIIHLWSKWQKLTQN
jgi:hypothetical protein